MPSIAERVLAAFCKNPCEVPYLDTGSDEAIDRRATAKMAHGATRK
jgi:hypothetical protein